MSAVDRRASTLRILVWEMFHLVSYRCIIKLELSTCHGMTHSAASRVDMEYIDSTSPSFPMLKFTLRSPSTLSLRRLCLKSFLYKGIVIVHNLLTFFFSTQMLLLVLCSALLAVVCPLCTVCPWNKCNSGNRLCKHVILLLLLSLLLPHGSSHNTATLSLWLNLNSETEIRKITYKALPTHFARLR